MTRRLCSVALTAVVGWTLVAAATAAATPLVSTPCGRATPASSTLKIVGNQMQDSDGNVLVPYGISLVGGPETKFWAQTERAALAQIIASHRYWHANAVRIQVGEAQLLDRPTPGHTYDVAFAGSVNRLVCQVLRQGQIPVINDTTLFTARSRGPTGRSVRFWKFMSRRYGKLPVIFDLFDEPRLGRNPRTDHMLRRGAVWRLWERGGRIAGKAYLGMQALVDTVRLRARAGNVVWVEEPWFLDPEKLPTAELPQHLLRGADIAYAFHKVALNERSGSFSALRAVAAKGIPLVDSEWSQFAATGRPWECQDGAFAGVPRFLDFLRQVPIGLMAWSLQPGALVRGVRGVDTVHDGNDYRFTTNPDALATPNEIAPSYRCNAASRGQGAGALVQDLFRRASAEPAPALFPRFR